MTQLLPTNGSEFDNSRHPIDQTRHDFDNSRQKQAVAAILRDVREGASLAQACEKHRFPLHLVFKLAEKDEETRADYAAAQRARAEILADEVIAIADNESADPAHNRNRMQARQWLASKTYAAKYGDKLQVEIEQRVSLADALKEAQGRVIPGSYQTIPDVTPTRIDSSLPAYRATDSQSDSEQSELDDLLS